MIRLFITILYILFYTSFAFGVEYYVKSGGNDDSAGTSDETAWATVAKVVATVTSGDTVYFRSQDTWTANDFPFLVLDSGVTYDGSTYGTGTRATILTNHAMEALNYAPVSIGVSNVTFRGFEVNGNSQKAYGIYIGLCTSANSTYSTSALNPGTKYYWRVRALH